MSRLPDSQTPRLPDSQTPKLLNSQKKTLSSLSLCKYTIIC